MVTEVYVTHLSWVLATLDHWDKKIFWGLNQLSDHPLWFLTNTLFSSKILWISFFAFLLLLSFSKGALRERTLVLMIIGCAGFTDAFNNYALKKTLQRPRPCQVFSSSEPLNSEEEKSPP